MIIENHLLYVILCPLFGFRSMVKDMSEYMNDVDLNELTTNQIHNIDKYIHDIRLLNCNNINILNRTFDKIYKEVIISIDCKQQPNFEDCIEYIDEVIMEILNDNSYETRDKDMLDDFFQKIEKIFI